jgi:hypothetical protein
MSASVREFYSVAKPRTGDFAELQRFALEVDAKLRRISERLAVMDGQPGGGSYPASPTVAGSGVLTGTSSAPGNSTEIRDIIRSAVGEISVTQFRALFAAWLRTLDYVTRQELTAALASLATRVYTHDAATVTLGPAFLNAVHVSVHASASTITLPAPSSGVMGRTLEFHRVGAGSLALAAPGSATIGETGTAISSTGAGQVACVQLRIITATRYAVTSAIGTWRTT